MPRDKVLKSRRLQSTRDVSVGRLTDGRPLTSKLSGLLGDSGLEILTVIVGGVPEVVFDSDGNVVYVEIP